MIDLDSFYVELGYSPNRTAKATRELFEFLVTNRHGPPDELLSDHVREFVREIITQCKAEHGTNIQPQADTMLRATQP